MCGLKLASKIRMMSKTIKIIVITAYETDLEDKMDSISTIIDKVIPKPVHLYDLKKMLENL